jgi:endonuclease/exonuclease/phosphatase family metal-dependent hydrolase
MGYVLKLLNWNILGPYATDIVKFIYKYPKVTNWEYRFNRLIRKIISLKPDIICLQEVDIENVKKFIDALSQYGFYKSSYESRDMTGGVMILHQSSKFELISKGNMQMTAQGKLEYPGAAAWATLLCKQSQQQFLVISLHLFWKLGKEQLDELLHAIAAAGSIPLILAGDFNISYATMINEIVSHFKELNIFKHVSLTTQPPHNQDPDSWESLDHVLFSQDLTIDEQQSFVAYNKHVYRDSMVITNRLIIDSHKKSIPNDVFPSDHLPIMVYFNY